MIAVVLLSWFGTTNAWTSLSPSIFRSRLDIPNPVARRHSGLSLPSCTLKETAGLEVEETILTDEVEVGNSSVVELIENNIMNNTTIHDVSIETTANIFTPEQKFTNLVVLSLAFGYATYTILSIDSGMTRGWSPSEIAMRIPLDNWGAYESYLANKPILTKSLINVIIYLLGDWLSQTAFKRTNLLEFDLQRTLRNGLIGLCFGPLVHEYYEFSDTILPPQNGLVTRMEKILMDQTIYLTIKCSLYIGAVGLLAGEDRESVAETIKDKIGGIVITA